MYRVGAHDETDLSGVSGVADERVGVGGDSSDGGEDVADMRMRCERDFDD